MNFQHLDVSLEKNGVLDNAGNAGASPATSSFLIRTWFLQRQNGKYMRLDAMNNSDNSRKELDSKGPAIDDVTISHNPDSDGSERNHQGKELAQTILTTQILP